MFLQELQECKKYVFAGVQECKQYVFAGVQECKKYVFAHPNAATSSPAKTNFLHS